ncbi:hypothetical protein VTH82DRAFT_171 [Thermothelomyces myriococcoides]
MQQEKYDNAQECLAICRAQFQQEMLKEWEGSNGWAEGCGILNRGTAAQEFWSLYWCDSTFCGVAINPDGGLGQDPSVDLIINTCQNIGFYSIFDPGPPPLNFSCSKNADMSSICSATITSASQSTPGPEISVIMTKLGTTTRWPDSTLVIPASPREPTTTSQMPSTASTTSGSNITEQGKAAIAVCSALGLLLLVCFTFVWLQRRKRRKGAFDRALRLRHDHPQGIDRRAGSLTALMFPTGLAVGSSTRGTLTPPLRLHDRKFLPSILRPGSRPSPSPPLTPLTPAYGLQLRGSGGAEGGASMRLPFSSPSCSQGTSTNKSALGEGNMTGQSTPRPNPAHESASLLFTKAILAPGSTRGEGNRRGSGGSTSYCCYATADGDGHGRACETETETGSSPCRLQPQLQSSHHPSLSSPHLPTSSPPCRPPRPHENMLEIPGLVNPAGYVAVGGGFGVRGVGLEDAAGCAKTVVKRPAENGNAGSSPLLYSPPLSPPPTKTLPQTPQSASMSPSLRGTAKRQLYLPDHRGFNSPPGLLSGPKDGWKLPHPRLPEAPRPVSPTVGGTYTNLDRPYLGCSKLSPSYFPDPGQFLLRDGTDRLPQQQPHSRENWPSWRGMETETDNDSCHNGGVWRNTDADVKTGTEVYTVNGQQMSRSIDTIAAEQIMMSAMPRSPNVRDSGDSPYAESQGK